MQEKEKILELSVFNLIKYNISKSKEKAMFPEKTPVNWLYFITDEKGKGESDDVEIPN